MLRCRWLMTANMRFSLRRQAVSGKSAGGADRLRCARRDAAAHIIVCPSPGVASNDTGRILVRCRPAPGVQRMGVHPYAPTDGAWDTMAVVSLRPRPASL